MNVLIGYIQKIFALFLLLVVARQLIPNGRLKKYIYFFTELVLIMGVMQPFFSFWGDNDALLDKIRSETFTENLSEASRDISRMAGCKGNCRRIFRTVWIYGKAIIVGTDRKL